MQPRNSFPLHASSPILTSISAHLLSSVPNSPPSKPDLPVTLSHPPGLLFLLPSLLGSVPSLFVLSATHSRAAFFQLWHPVYVAIPCKPRASWARLSSAQIPLLHKLFNYTWLSAWLLSTDGVTQTHSDRTHRVGEVRWSGREIKVVMVKWWGRKRCRMSQERNICPCLKGKSALFALKKYNLQGLTWTLITPRQYSDFSSCQISL